MSRPRLKAELSLFGDHLRPATAPQPEQPHRPFLHPCQAPGCGAWGAFGFRAADQTFEQGAFFCAEHKQMGERR